ncbi:MAG: hypothetical protein WBF38_06900 [Nitrosotalea sp.]
MKIYRYSKDNPDDVFELIVNDGVSLKSIYAIHSIAQRQPDSCGVHYSKTTYSIRCVPNRSFCERWENEAHRAERDRAGWRTIIPYQVGLEAFTKFAEIIKKISSESEEDVVETYESIRQFIEDKAMEDATETRP